MAESNLLFIGAILSIALGTLSLTLVRKNEKLAWNEKVAAHILCWMFVCKGLQNAAVGYMNELPDSLLGADTSSHTYWQFWLALSTLLDYAFSFSIMALSLIYPIPLLRNSRQVKIGFVILFSLLIFRLGLTLTGNLISIWELPSLLYLVAGVAWGTIYVKFRLIDKSLRNESTENIAKVSCLFLILVMGHIWFWWPGMILQSEYYYYFDREGILSSVIWDYFWQFGLTACIAVGICLISIEIYQAINEQTSSMVYFLLAYFIIGAIGFVILSRVETVHHVATLDRGTELSRLWSTLTSQVHFTIMRPLIAMYILIKFGLFDINEETKPTAKIMTIILIVVATSAILELIQSIIPINQMVSAALLGIIIAFGIGWEEKSFDNLINSRVNLRKDIDAKWFPEIKQIDKLGMKIDIAFFVYILISFLICFLVWQTDMYLQFYLEKGGG